MAKHRKGKVRSIEDEHAKQKMEQLDRQAQQLLNEAHARTDRVDRISDTLRKIREKNHLGELVYDAVMGRP